jgi:hypothetical protein
MEMPAIGTIAMMAASVADTIPSLWPIIVGISFFGGYVSWCVFRSREVLERWAKANDFEILQSEYRNLFLGPFAFSTASGQSVYYVRVRDQTGRERGAWVRCGSFWAGVFSDKAEVRWEDEPAPHQD